MRNIQLPKWVTGGFALACLFAAGCGNPDLSVKGAVSFGGKAIESGSISFDPADGVGPSLGGTIEAGRYEVTGRALPGKKIVRIRGVQKTGRKVEAGMPAPKGTKVDEIKSVVPPTFNDKSTLEIELQAGTTERDFDLK